MSRLNPALTRALNILELLATANVSPTLREITEVTELPRTSVFELVNTLVARGYLSRTAEEPGRYALGARTLELGSAFERSLDYVALGREMAAKLSDRSSETSHVAILDGTDVVYIAKADSPHQVRMVSSVGVRLPAHCTSVGKALLSALADQEFDIRYPNEGQLVRLTRDTITSVATLKKEIALVRKRGWAIEECESNPDVCCAAAPVRDGTGQVVSAISVSVPEHRWVAKSTDHWTSLVTDAAETYALGLGFNPRSGSPLTSMLAE